VLNSRGHFNSGGYTFALDNSQEFPGEPFLAVPVVSTAVRTEGKYQSYQYLHRYFFKQQQDSVPRGLAASLSAEYVNEVLRTSTALNATTFASDSTFYGPYAIDDRGVRYAVSSQTVLAKALIEYYTSPEGDLPVAFNFQAGAYGGSQAFDAEYLTARSSQPLFGLTGRLSGQVLDRFQLEAEADIPLSERIGEGFIDASLSWEILSGLSVSADLLLERSSAPLAAGVLGVNATELFRTNLPVSTHSRIGGSATYQPLNLSVSAYLDVFADAIVYEAYGIPAAASTEIAIPTLSYQLPLPLGPLTLDSRGVLRNPPQSRFVSVPAYTGQHALYARFKLFKNNMDLMVGADSWVRSSADRYGYFPLTNVFTIDPLGREADWQYSLDAFVAFKVASFKGFARLDRILVSNPTRLPATVEGYPIARAGGLLPGGSILRLGVSFFLFD
jgi:hypothetical protein